MWSPNPNIYNLGFSNEIGERIISFENEQYLRFHSPDVLDVKVPGIKLKNGGRVQVGDLIRIWFSKPVF